MSVAAKQLLGLVLLVVSVALRALATELRRKT